MHQSQIANIHIIENKKFHSQKFELVEFSQNKIIFLSHTNTHGILQPQNFTRIMKLFEMIFFHCGA